MIDELRPRKKSYVAEAIAAASKPLPVPDPVVLIFRAPAAVLGVNQVRGSHWTTKAARDAWKQAGTAVAYQYRTVLTPFFGQRVRITVALPLATPTRADTGNYASGVSVKYFQDGLAETGILVPDDTAKWLDTAVVFWKGGPTKDEVRVKVEVIPPADDPGMWTV